MDSIRLKARCETRRTANQLLLATKIKCIGQRESGRIAYYRMGDYKEESRRKREKEEEKHTGNNEDGKKEG